MMPVTPIRFEDIQIGDTIMEHYSCRGLTRTRTGVVKNKTVDAVHTEHYAVIGRAMTPPDWKDHQLFLVDRPTEPLDHDSASDQDQSDWVSVWISYLEGQHGVYVIDGLPLTPAHSEGRDS